MQTEPFLLLGGEGMKGSHFFERGSDAFWSSEQGHLLIGGVFDHRDQVGERFPVDFCVRFFETLFVEVIQAKNAFQLHQHLGLPILWPFQKDPHCFNFVGVLADELGERFEVILRLLPFVRRVFAK